MTTILDERAPSITIALSDPRACEPNLAGQKASSLARLMAAGFAVPEGRVLPIGSITRWSTEAAAALSREMSGKLAVRSSALAEDLAGASFAGMYATVLDVEGREPLERAVAEVLASAESDRARAYHPRGTAMAVLMQRLVQPDAAGVAFTADPITGERDVVLVSAVRGLGDRLVAGEVDPEEWEVRGGAARCRAASGVLTEAQACAVAELARRVEAHDGEPRDIEWALSGEELWLLQARPITALPLEPALPSPAPGTWTKERAHFNEPMTPFGASLYLPALEEATAAAFAEFGMLVERIQTSSRGGEPYGRVLPVGGKDGPAPPAWVLGLVARLHPALRARMRAAREVIRGGLLEAVAEEWSRELRARFVADIDALLDERLEELDERALLRHLDDARALLARGQRTHFRLFIPYVVAIAELARGCEEMLGWSPAEAMRLVTGLSPASSEPTRALGAVAELARKTQGGREALASMRDASDLDATPALAQAFRELQRRHGWRTIAYDPGAPTLAERPALLARLIVDQLDAEELGDGASTREQAAAEARRLLADRPADRSRFEALLEAGQRCYPLREDNIALTDNFPCGVLRRVMIECGRRLVSRGRLVEADDARWLDAAELRDALSSEGSDLRALVDRRMREDRWVRAHPGPDFHGPPPAAPPDPRWLPAEGRRMNSAMMWFMDQELTPPAPSKGPTIVGRPGSGGRVRGRVRVVLSEADFSRLAPGEVLVCPITSPVWSVLFANAAALVTDGGGAMSHAAVIAREHAIPAVLATGDGTRRLTDGQWVTVDGNAGTVTPDA